MSSVADVYVTPTLKAYASGITILSPRPEPPRRTAPFDEEPGYHKPAKLWLYGNARLLQAELVHIPEACGPNVHSMAQLDEIERKTEELVLAGKTLVCGIHNDAHRRAAIVPLRWGAPRVLVLSGGFKHHLGEKLDQEPFRAARLWRYQWDVRTDLVVSRRAPEKPPTFALYNPTVDRMITRISQAEWPGLRWIMDALTRVLA